MDEIDRSMDEIKPLVPAGYTIVRSEYDSIIIANPAGSLGFAITLQQITDGVALNTAKHAIPELIRISSLN